MVTKSRVVVVGAGNICNGFLFHAKDEDLLKVFDFLILDNESETLHRKKKDFPFVQTQLFDADKEKISDVLLPADWVISLLPPRYHTGIANSCLLKHCHLLTSSYITEELEQLKPSFIQKELILITELGLDPGIDQILAINSINKIQEEGGTIASFKSYAGSYFDSEDPSDWGYRITWNPENIINAGKEETKYLKNGRVVELPYSEVFKTSIDELSYIDKKLEVYPNRNSLKILNKYNLPEVQTFIRGTIRKRGFLKLWQSFIDKGLTQALPIPEYLKTQEAFNASFSFSPIDIAFLEKMKLNDGSFMKYSNTYEWLLGEMKLKWEFDSESSEEFVFLVQEIGFQTADKETFLNRREFIVFRNSGALSAMSSVVGKVLSYSLKKIHSNRNIFLNNSSVVSTSLSIDLLNKVLSYAQYSSNIED